MIAYIITPEVGEIVVSEDRVDLAWFTYNEGWDGNWEVFDSADINGPPVASGLASQYDVWIWVHSIDPDTFREEYSPEDAQKMGQAMREAFNG